MPFYLLNNAYLTIIGFRYCALYEIVMSVVYNEIFKGAFSLMKFHILLKDVGGLALIKQPLHTHTHTHSSVKTIIL